MKLLPVSPEKQTNSLAEIPHESVWLANFISAQTKRTYQNSVRDFITFHGITTPEELRGIDQAYLIAWRDRMLDAGASPKTVCTRLSALSSLFGHLCEKRVAQFNPTVGVKRPNTYRSEVKTPVITAQQVRQMLDAPDTANLKGQRDNAILHILFYTGCRVAEVTKLKVKDLYEDNGYWVLDFVVKGGKHNRLAIHQELYVALREYLNHSGHGEEDNAPLVLATQRAHLRKHLDPLHVNRIFKSYAKKVGLAKGITPHSARATFITQALEGNCPIEAVQRSVAHSRIDTTKMYDKREAKHRESASFAVGY